MNRQTQQKAYAPFEQVFKYSTISTFEQARPPDPPPITTKSYSQ